MSASFELEAISRRQYSFLSVFQTWQGYYIHELIALMTSCTGLVPDLALQNFSMGGREVYKATN